MASPTPLHGTDLIDCAKANAKKGVETAAQRCGYGQDVSSFEQELRQAGLGIGVEINQLSDLITDQETMTSQRGIEIGPDTPSQL